MNPVLFSGSASAPPCSSSRLCLAFPLLTPCISPNKQYQHGAAQRPPHVRQRVRRCDWTRSKRALIGWKPQPIGASGWSVHAVVPPHLREPHVWVLWLVEKGSCTRLLLATVKNLAFHNRVTFGLFQWI